MVVCGPSGTGKSTLLTRLFQTHPDTFGFSISHTTRHSRAGEQDGREYHFVSRDEFMQRVEKGEFLEWAQFGGNWSVPGLTQSPSHIVPSRTYERFHSYGTTFAALRALSPKRCILDIELQGVLQLRAKAPLQSPPLHPVFLFLAPPSLTALKSRLKGRGTETDESMRKRLVAARAEVKYAMEGGHDVIVVNEDVGEAGRKVEMVAMGWERWQRCGDRLPDFDLKELD